MKKSTGITLISLTAASLVAVSAVSAHQGTRSPTGTEDPATMGEHFDRADTNDDGRLDSEELNTYMNERRAQMRFERMDRNGDGSISPEEFGPTRRGDGRGHMGGQGHMGHMGGMGGHGMGGHGMSGHHGRGNR